MNVISVSTKAETLLCDDRIVLLQYQNKLLSKQAKEIMPAVLPINRTDLPLMAHTWKLLHSLYI